MNRLMIGGLGVIALVAAACGSGDEPQQEVIAPQAQEYADGGEQHELIAHVPQEEQVVEQQVIEEPEPEPQVRFEDIEPAVPFGTRARAQDSDNYSDKYLFRWMWLTGDFNGSGSLLVGCQKLADALLWADTDSTIEALPNLKWCFETLTRESRAARGQVYRVALMSWPGISYEPTLARVDLLIGDIKAIITEAREALKESR